MKNGFVILIILSVYFTCSALSCNNCSTSTRRLDSTKSWFPIKNVDRLPFVDSAGNITNFELNEIDTVEVANNDCLEPFFIESIRRSLYLNLNRTDSIYFSLGSGAQLYISALSNNSTNIVIFNVFGKALEQDVVKQFVNYRVGNRTYQDVILMTRKPFNSDNIDSVYIANNEGIVGFKYSGRSYTLQ